jgi:hypothetical protein
MRRKLSIVLGGTLLIIAAVLVFMRSSGQYVTVVALPKDSSIKLDGKPIKAGRVKLSSGKHTFLASRQFFDDDQQTIDTKKLTTKTLYLLPKPNSAEAVQWLHEHPEVQREREAAGGEDAIVKQKALLDQYPIIAKLPHETLDYKVDYAVDADGTVSFKVTLYPFAKPSTPEYESQINQEKEGALSYLKNNGVDTIKTSITYAVSQ